MRIQLLLDRMNSMRLEILFISTWTWLCMRRRNITDDQCVLREKGQNAAYIHYSFLYMLVRYMV